ncbi:MAG: radical SAM protein [Candidatus Woesearchaeota archaeon]|jgi:radical SAM superfamily enzyme YgiQ (UPF0313 family)
MKKILLINPPNPPGYISNKDMMGGFGQLAKDKWLDRVPPLDLPSTAASLIQKGHHVEIIDCLGLELNLTKLVELIKKKSVDYVGIRSSTPTFYLDLEVAREIKKILSVPIIIFGSHISVFADKTINCPEADAIIVGEPELTFVEIAEKGFENTPGVWYRKGNEIFKNEKRNILENLDELPFPAWDLMPWNKYNVGEYLRNLTPSFLMQTSRGCPYGCMYCPYPIAQGLRWRPRSSENVLKEIHYLKDKYGMNSVLFRDAIFTLDRNRTIKICEGIITENLKFSWRCETRADRLDEELIKLMAKAGCIGINMGVESASERVCKSSNRKYIPLTHIKKLIKCCRKNGIEVYLFFIIGLKGDNVFSITKTIYSALRLNATFTQFTVVSPYPGTDIEKWARENNYVINEKWDHITGWDATMRNDKLPLWAIKSFHKAANALIFIKEKISK